MQMSNPNGSLSNAEKKCIIPLEPLPAANHEANRGWKPLQRKSNPVSGPFVWNNYPANNLKEEGK